MDTVAEVFGNPSISMRLQIRQASESFSQSNYKSLQTARAVTLIEAQKFFFKDRSDIKLINKFGSSKD